MPGQGWVGFWAMFMSYVLCFHTWFLGVPDTHLGPCWGSLFLGSARGPQGTACPSHRGRRPAVPLSLSQASPSSAHGAFCLVVGPEPSGPNSPCASFSLS